MHSGLQSADMRRMETLVWLSEQGEGKHSVLPCYLNERGGWRTPESNKDGRRDLEALAAKGLVEGHIFDLTSSSVSITPSGQVKADELKRAWSDRPTRVAHCRTAVLMWLYTRGVFTPAQAVNLDRFLVDPYSTFHWKQFPEDEIQAALGRLRAAELVRTPDGRTESNLYLTDEGIACVEQYNGDILQYLKGTSSKVAPERAESGPIINIHGGQVQMATGNYSHQMMQVGVAAEQLLLVIEGVAEIVRGLQLSDEQRVMLDRLRETAAADLSSAKPSVKGVRRFYDWVIECAKEGGGAALTAAITAAANGMLQDAERVVHAITQ